MKAFRKRFRIRRRNNRLPEYRYEILQRHTILFFIHWYDTPEFEPPHAFGTPELARNCIWEHHPNAIIQDEIMEDKL